MHGTRKLLHDLIETSRLRFCFCNCIHIFFSLKKNKIKLTKASLKNPSFVDFALRAKHSPNVDFSNLQKRECFGNVSTRAFKRDRHLSNKL